MRQPSSRSTRPITHLLIEWHNGPSIRRFDARYITPTGLGPKHRCLATPHPRALVQTAARLTRTTEPVPRSCAQTLPKPRQVPPISTLTAQQCSCEDVTGGRHHRSRRDRRIRRRSNCRELIGHTKRPACAGLPLATNDLRLLGRDELARALHDDLAAGDLR
jgi:hypothetical protein